MLDLKAASRDSLVRLTVSQHETMQQQERVLTVQGRGLPHSMHRWLP